MKKNNAFVVIFCLMMISLIVMLTEQLLRSVMVGSQFVKTMIVREHAEMLALGGINIAIAQLTFEEEKKDKDKKDEDKKDSDKKDEEKKEEKGEGLGQNQDKEGKLTPIKKFVFSLLSHLGRWQIFNFDPKIDGIEGQIKLCITAEAGKLNINEAFDFQKQEFKKEYEAILKSLDIPGKLALGELHTKLVDLLKKRKCPLDELTDLLNVPELTQLDAFYRPPEMIAKEKQSRPNAAVTLQDMFTIWTDDEKVDPILFSDAMCAVFGLRRPSPDDAKKLKDRFGQVAHAFKKDWGSDWEANWKYIQIIYEQKPKMISEIKGIFSKSFNPTVYSVLSYGKVENVEQRVLAIIKYVDEEQASDKKEKAEKDGEKQAQEKKENQDKKEDKVKPKKHFKIMRLYWL